MSPTPDAPAGTKEVTERPLLLSGDPEALLKLVEERIKKQEEQTAITVPPNVTYQQLLALARKAVTPSDQQKVLSAFETARNKPPPKTLLEMYNGDNETRAIAMLEASFPAKAAQEDAYTKQAKYAKAYKDVADAIRARQLAEESQAAEALKTQKAYREESEIAAGDVIAERAQKLAKARALIESAGNDAEKARRIRELVEVEKAAMAATGAEKAAQMAEDWSIKVKAAGLGGVGGKKRDKDKENLEWQIKTKVFSDNIDEERKIIANLEAAAQRAKAIGPQRRQLVALRQQAIAQGPAFAPNVAAYDTKIAELDGEIAGLPPLTEIQLQLSQHRAALQALSQRYQQEADEMMSRWDAKPSARTSVPLINNPEGAGEGAGEAGETGKTAPGTKPGTAGKPKDKNEPPPKKAGK